MWRHNFHINRRLPPPRFLPVKTDISQSAHDWLVDSFTQRKQYTLEGWEVMNKKYRLQSKKGVHIYCLHLSKEKKKKLIIVSSPRRYSRVLRGDLATEQGTRSCERRQQAGCVGGNFFFSSSHYRLVKIYLMFTLYLVSHVLLCAALCLPGVWKG